MAAIIAPVPYITDETVAIAFLLPFILESCPNSIAIADATNIKLHITLYGPPIVNPIKNINK